MDVTIRKGKREDMTQVFIMIKALADSEGFRPDLVKITPQILMKDGFDTNPPAFECFVAETPNGSLIGFALYFTCYSTWLGKSIFLEDLYVHSDYRNKGIGKGLLKAVGKVAYETSKRLDFNVLSVNPAMAFYKKLAAKNLSEDEHWQVLRFYEDGLEKLLR